MGVRQQFRQQIERWRRSEYDGPEYDLEQPVISRGWTGMEWVYGYPVYSEVLNDLTERRVPRGWYIYDPVEGKPIRVDPSSIRARLAMRSADGSRLYEDDIVHPRGHKPEIVGILERCSGNPDRGIRVHMHPACRKDGWMEWTGTQYYRWELCGDRRTNPDLLHGWGGLDWWRTD